MPDPRRNPVAERLDRVLNQPPRGTPTFNLAYEAMEEIDRLQREREGLLEATEEIRDVLANPPRHAWTNIDTAAALARNAIAECDREAE